MNKLEMEKRQVLQVCLDNDLAWIFFVDYFDNLMMVIEISVIRH